MTKQFQSVAKLLLSCQLSPTYCQRSPKRSLQHHRQLKQQVYSISSESVQRGNDRVHVRSPAVIISIAQYGDRYPGERVRVVGILPEPAIADLLLPPTCLHRSLRRILRIHSKTNKKQNQGVSEKLYIIRLRQGQRQRQR